MRILISVPSTFSEAMPASRCCTVSAEQDFTSVQLPFILHLFVCCFPFWGWVSEPVHRRQVRATAAYAACTCSNHRAALPSPGQHRGRTLRWLFPAPLHRRKPFRGYLHLHYCPAGTIVCSLLQSWRTDMLSACTKHSP